MKEPESTLTKNGLHVFDLSEEAVAQLAPVHERYYTLQRELDMARDYYQELLEAQFKLLVGKSYDEEVCPGDVVVFSESGKHLIYGKYCDGCECCVDDDD